MLNYFPTILSRITQERQRTKSIIYFSVFRHVCIPWYISIYLCEQILHKHTRLFKTHKLCLTPKPVHPDIRTFKVSSKIVCNLRTAGMKITQGLFPYFRLYFLVIPVFIGWEFQRKNLHCMCDGYFCFVRHLIICLYNVYVAAFLIIEINLKGVMKFTLRRCDRINISTFTAIMLIVTLCFNWKNLGSYDIHTHTHRFDRIAKHSFNRFSNHGD